MNHILKSILLLIFLIISEASDDFQQQGQKLLDEVFIESYSTGSKLQTENTNEADPPSPTNTVASNDLNCSQYQFEYTLPNGTKRCEHCQKGCNGCSGFSINCSSCQIGFYLATVPNETNSQRCMNCPPSCMECTSPTNCSICNIGYGTITRSNGCYRCSTPLCFSCKDGICMQCQSNSYQVEINSTTFEKACYQCNIPGCIYCLIYPYSSNNSIMSMTCKTCQANQMVIQNKEYCQPCVQNCAACNSSTTCSLCNPGYILPNPKLADTCQDHSCGIEHCTGCFNINQGCLSCQDGYYFTTDKTQCLPCDPTSNCQACYLNYSTICTSCPDGYYMNENQTCSACTPGCSSCLSNETCEFCNEGYLLTSSNLCQDCPQNCAECLSGTTACSTCSPGYTLNSDQNSCSLCSSITEGCSTCLNQTTCTSCIEDYLFVYENNTCILCSGSLTGCQYCDPLTYQCQACLNGHTMSASNNSCLQCPTNCLKCIHLENSDAMVCLECQTGTSISIDQNSCYTCGNTPQTQNCLLCNSSVNCITCMPGYEIFGDVCNQSPTDNSDDGLPAWAIVIIILVCIAVVGLIIGVITIIQKKRNSDINANLVDNSQGGYAQISRER